MIEFLQLYIVLLVLHAPLYHYGMKWAKEMMEEGDAAHDLYIKHTQL